MWLNACRPGLRYSWSPLKLDHVTLKFPTGTNGAHMSAARFWWWKPWVLLLFMCMTNNANSTLWPGTLILRRDWYEKKDRADKEKLEQQRKECFVCGTVFSQLNANLNASDSLHSNINKPRSLSPGSEILLPFFFFSLYNWSNLDKSTINLSQHPKQQPHWNAVLRALLKLNYLMLANNLISSRIIMGP